MATSHDFSDEMCWSGGHYLMNSLDQHEDSELTWFLNQSLSLVALAWLSRAYGPLKASWGSLLSVLPSLSLLLTFSPSLSLPSAGLQGWMGPPIPPGLPRCWAIWCSEKELQGHVMSSPPCQVNQRCKNVNSKNLAREQVSWDLSVSLLISVHLLIQIFTGEKVICLILKFSWSGMELSLKWVTCWFHEACLFWDREVNLKEVPLLRVFYFMTLWFQL